MKKKTLLILVLIFIPFYVFAEDPLPSKEDAFSSIIDAGIHLENQDGKNTTNEIDPIILNDKKNVTVQ